MPVLIKDRIVFREESEGIYVCMCVKYPDACVSCCVVGGRRDFLCNLEDALKGET